MISGSGRSGHVALLSDGLPLCVLNERAFGFDVGDRAYAVRRTGFIAPSYALRCGDEEIARAQQKPFVNRFALSHAGRSWTFKAEDLAARTYALFDDAEQVGRIAPSGFLAYAKIDVDLPTLCRRRFRSFSSGSPCAAGSIEGCAGSSYPADFARKSSSRFAAAVSV